MAITATNAKYSGRQPSAPTYVDCIDVLCDALYPAGGWPLSLTTLLPNGVEVIAVLAEVKDATGGFVLQYDRATSKLLAFECAAAGNPLAEISGAELNAQTVRLVVLSR